MLSSMMGLGLLTNQASVFRAPGQDSFCATATSKSVTNNLPEALKPIRKAGSAWQDACYEDSWAPAYASFSDADDQGSQDAGFAGIYDAEDAVDEDAGAGEISLQLYMMIFGLSETDYAGGTQKEEHSGR